MWFLEHFETIWNNRHKLKQAPYADIVIEDMTINGFGSPYGSYQVKNIRLGDLVMLWDNGFIYKQLPLIHYHLAYGDSSTRIAYVRNGKIVKRRFDISDNERYEPNERVKKMLKCLRKANIL